MGRAGLRRGAELVAAALFATMFGAFMVQIVSRYVFNHPVQWSLELCSLGYIWLVFWSSDLLVEERQHIRFDLLYKKIPARPRRAVAITNTAALGLVFLAGLPWSLEYISFMGRRSTLVLHIPLDIAYSCFGIFMIAVIVNAAVRLGRLLGPTWQQHL
jgi:TRAP-type C4-dicarboxylate transport system permease small subunit